MRRWRRGVTTVHVGITGAAFILVVCGELFEIDVPTAHRKIGGTCKASPTMHRESSSGHCRALLGRLGIRVEGCAVAHILQIQIQSKLQSCLGGQWAFAIIPTNKQTSLRAWWAVGSCQSSLQITKFQSLVGSWRSCLKLLIFARNLIANEKRCRNILLNEPLLTPTWTDYNDMVEVTTNWAETGPAYFNNQPLKNAIRNPSRNRTFSTASKITTPKSGLWRQGQKLQECAITGDNNIFREGERHGYSKSAIGDDSRTIRARMPSFKKSNVRSVLPLHSFLRYWKRDLRHTRFLEIGLEREPDAVPAKYGWRKFGDER